MEDVVVPSYEAAQRQANEILACHDAPAYVRRARKVEEALETILQCCQIRREEWLFMPRILLGALHGLAGTWSNLRPLLADEEQVALLPRLFTLLKPRPRLPVAPTTSARVLVRALQDLRTSLERFNQRWPLFLEGVDLTAVNEFREGYNRYYLLEKECALRNPRLARLGFQRLAPLSARDLLEMMPRFPVPLLRRPGTG